MQETFLARRCVSFHANEILWECQSLSDCECGGSRSHPSEVANLPHFVTCGVGGAGDSGKIVYEHDLMVLQYPKHFSPVFMGISFFWPSSNFSYYMRPFSQIDDASALYEEWRQMVIPLYTRRELTYITDRLPALSGMAKYVANYCQDEYLAGLWRGDIHLGLLWSIKNFPDKCPVSYIAPSFSWASVDREIQYALPHPYNLAGKSRYGNIGFELLDAKTGTRAGAPFGIVDSGYLKLRGHCVGITLTFGGQRVSFSTRHELIDGKFWPDSFLNTVSIVDKSCDRPYTSVNRSQEWAASRFHVEAEVLLIAYIPHDPESEDHLAGIKQDEYAGIVIGRLGSSPEAYQRLGLVILSCNPTLREKWLCAGPKRQIVVI